ncbi:hypothetical protein GLOTRDRAFT_139840 [Gloeophyllum trabeum ATCC 11539]|uniref:Uncharacterized protein n=1 Tax=Gloeophyllum trabeum (strain ATCC 11539 / FP-39264 / Madison 617) TaxID=670483 RepID=S7RHD7_GLOTA|nr:uncharacterized protein GLOTRDRAFT_139840 [Gloeophyllum trabeum ATCC 11539]EPQ53700.1 hypothetical protein GLOTRDRAFT_139840 [Gloeophyllum trabeum ATCC 11539]
MLRRLSVSVDDVSRRTNKIETSERKGLMGGAIGKWLEQEWDYQRHSLPGIDNMWFLLQRETDFNPVCAGIFTFKDAFTFESLVSVWSAMTERYPAYRQRVTGLNRRFHTARLKEDLNFDVRNNITVVEMPDGKNGKDELEDEMARFIARDWDLSKPLWEVIVFYNYRDETGAKCAVITRAHHALSDGQGFVLSQLSITSAGPKIEAQLKKAAAVQCNLEVGRAKLSDLPINGLGKRLKPLDPFVPSVLVTLLFWVLWLLFSAITILYDVYTCTRAVLIFVSFRRKALQYDGPRREEKEFSFSDAISLQDIKVVQKAFQTPLRRITLNDVMCAVVTKTIRQYCEEHGGFPDKRVALFIPISIRSPSDQRMKNLSTGATAYFNAHKPCTQALIHACHDEMQKLKTAFYPRIAFAFLEHIYRIPMLFPHSIQYYFTHHGEERNVMDERIPIIDWAMSNFHGVLTNVPGPSSPFDVDGAEVLRWTASPPQAGKGTLGLGMISYNGHLVWTVTADKVEQYQGVARYLTRGFKKTFEEFLEEAKSLQEHDDSSHSLGINGHSILGNGKAHSD